MSKIDLNSPNTFEDFSAKLTLYIGNAEPGDILIFIKRSATCATFTQTDSTALAIFLGKLFARKQDTFPDNQSPDGLEGSTEHLAVRFRNVPKLSFLRPPPIKAAPFYFLRGDRLW